MTNRQQIMVRAWELFRATYRYPAIPFRSIGRACFASSLRRAWAEAREAARVAAIPPAEKAERVAELRDAIAGLTCCDDFQRAAHARKQMKKEIVSLAA